MANSAKVSWAIRHFSKKIAGSNEFELFMTTHYSTREEMRKAWRGMNDFKKDGKFFDAKRFRVTEWEAVNKIAYEPTR
ncbi:UNVERIFIED_CONTAM: hypothetical protein RF648_19920 [Kocuria sp. CPCC 205274]